MKNNYIDYSTLDDYQKIQIVHFLKDVRLELLHYKKMTLNINSLKNNNYCLDSSLFYKRLILLLKIVDSELNFFIKNFPNLFYL